MGSDEDATAELVQGRVPKTRTLAAELNTDTYLISLGMLPEQTVTGAVEVVDPEGTEHNSYAAALYQTARLKRARGELEEARGFAQQALAIREANRLPDEHISMRRTRELLASL